MDPTGWYAVVTSETVEQWTCWAQEVEQAAQVSEPSWQLALLAVAEILKTGCRSGLPR